MDKPKGWSQYTLLHRHGGSPVPSVDPFPSLSPTSTSHQLHAPPELALSYSHALSGGRHTPGRTHASALKGLYPWAPEDLIEDILGYVKDDEKSAMELLDSMFATISSEDSITSSTPDGSTSEREAASLDRISSATECPSDGAVSSSKSLESCVIQEPLRLSDDLKGFVKGPPVEPEWEEDDPYFFFRKDALKSSRAGYRHAKSASHAYNVGDHHKAQVLSRKAQKQRTRAQELNAKAASEILRVKNENQDIWRLDLHGLHAYEAVTAVQARLSEIEQQKVGLSSLRSVRGSLLNRYSQAGSREMTCESIDPKEKHLKSLAPNLPQNEELTVIIGSGNHSRGNPTIPNAVESYLDTNQYRYKKPRPGIITIKPKRHFLEDTPKFL